MKNKEFQKLLKKNRFKPNSGFTLTELLVGLFMSTFVIGALGFGLMQVLRTTQSETSKVAARNESSRALDFISDEMRRAQAIEVDMTTGAGSNIASVAPAYSLPTGGTVRLALQIPGVVQRVIYSVAPPDSSSPWKGPLVIYRWGPNLDASGNYTDPTNIANWNNEALVDGVSNENQTEDCDNNGDGIEETITYQGFFACVVDDDGDRDAAGNLIVENVTDANGDGEISFADDPNDRNGDGEINFGDTLTDTNGDGEITFADSTLDTNGDGEINADDGADVDGQAITAQLYFTGGTTTASGADSTYSADTNTVARARTAPENNSLSFKGYSTAFRTLDPSFSCNPSTNTDWSMRTDFGDSLSNPSEITWDHRADAQPQPIMMNSDTLVVSSIPRGGSDCINSREGNGHGSTGTEDFTGNETLGETADWHTDPNNDVVAISHAINFNDPRTFNGDPITCTSYPCASSTDGKVYSQKDGTAAELNPYVVMLKEGSPVPPYNGYDMNGDGDTLDNGEQISLGEFLESKGLATPDGSGGYTIDGLQNNERIIAFEIGKSDVSDTTAPGVDFQDNIFVLQSDAFKQKYKTYTDNGGSPQSYSVLP
ncbi:hypothetical protein IQ255_28665 [Pleurocapsales cyanobacterium LEGE 10410]|nr:hypothetical protein [Pleurocapsales cyanobacterium LEGE 10410]